MDYSAFKKLLAFFSALKDSGFRRTLKEIPNSTLIRGARTPVDKEFAMKMLHAFPEFQSDQFKDDNAIIKYLSDPRNRERILSRFTPNLRRELETQLNEKAGPSDTQMQIKEQAVSDREQGQPQAGGSAPAGGMPALPSAPAMPRIMRNIPHTPETPKPDIAIASSSGHVTEAGDPSKLVTPESVARGDASKLVSTSGGVVSEKGDASKLVSSSGRPLRETAHSGIGQGKSVPSGRRFNTSFFRSSAGNVFKRFQNFASPANPFLKRNLSRIGENLKGMFGNLGNAGGRALVGGLNLGGNTAGRLSGFGSSIGGKMRGFGNTASSAVKGGGKKFALASGLGFLLFFLTAMSGNMTGTTPTGNAAPPAPVPPGPITPPAPCTGGNYKDCLAANYKLNFEAGFPDSFLKMAYDTLSSADSNAPKFKSLLISSCSSGIIVKPTSGTSHVSGCTMNLKPTIGAVAFIHELGHIIRNSNPSFYENIITQARQLDSAEWDGFLTYYSRYSSAPDDFSTECYSSQTASLDEEFAESVTYFINYTAKEIPMGRGCSVKWTDDNPYQNGNRYKGHYNLMSGILK